MSSILIGASEVCDLIVTNDSISGQHCLLKLIEESYFIEDLSSTNGTYVNGYRITSTMITSEDQIRLGSYETTLPQLLRLFNKVRQPSTPIVNTLAPQTNSRHISHIREIEVGISTIILGRNKGRVNGDGSPLDVQVEGGNNFSVSGQHARVFYNCGRIILEDLGSMSGSFLIKDGISTPTMIRYCEVEAQDLIKIGNEYFRFTTNITMADPHRGQRIDVHNVSYTVLDRETQNPLRLVNDVSFSAYSGEIVAIMGPSGSGKTTLLNMVAGLNVPSSGQVLINGQSIFNSGKLNPTLGRLIGHAPQFDASYSKLTVEETLVYTAQLRGPSNWTELDIQNIVNKTLQDVGLIEQRHIFVGSKDEKTLSGGQRKRVNIAMELVTGCEVLLLDEPTSGLSSHDAAELIEMLRTLSFQGKTVILTIHQPAYESYIQMDHLLLLEEGGHIAYFGPTAKDSFDYFSVTERNVDVILRCLERKSSREQKGIWASTFIQKQHIFVQQRLSTLQPMRLTPPALPSFFKQFMIITSRLAKLKLRDNGFVGLVAVFPIVVAAVFALVIGAELSDDMKDHYRVEHGMLVILTIMTCFFGSLSTVLEFTAEKAIWLREQRVNVNPIAYLLSKLTIYGIVSIIFPFLACCTVLLFGNNDGVDLLSGGLLDYWPSMGTTFFAASSAGLFLSSFVASRKLVSFNLAIYLAVLYSIVQIIFAVFAPLHIAYNDDNQAQWLKPVSAITNARWSMSGVLTTNDICQDTIINRYTPKHRSLVIKQHHELCKRNYSNSGVYPHDSKTDRTSKKTYWWSFLANIILSLATILLSLIFIRKVGKN